MTIPSAAHMRRTPRQQRSRERVERILDAAAAIVVDDGLDKLTVSGIAKRARVPLGTVYQFFAHKEDIIFALAQRFADRFGEVLEASLDVIGADVGWHELLDLLLDAYASHYRSEPALRELWVGARLDPDFIRADHEHNNTRFAAAVADVMADRALVPRDELALMVYVCWEAGQALLETAFRTDPNGESAIIEQTKVMAARYLRPAFENVQGRQEASWDNSRQHQQRSHQGFDQQSADVLLRSGLVDEHGDGAREERAAPGGAEHQSGIAASQQQRGQARPDEQPPVGGPELRNTQAPRQVKADDGADPLGPKSTQQPGQDGDRRPEIARRIHGAVNPLPPTAAQRLRSPQP